MAILNARKFVNCDINKSFRTDGGIGYRGTDSSKSTTSSNTFNIVGAASADVNNIINFIQSAWYGTSFQSPGGGSNS